MILPLPIAETLFPIRVPHLTRPPSRPMQILALGLPRTGTDSLRNALGLLGYDKVYHGFSVVEQDVWTDARAWYNLLSRKAQGDRRPVARRDLDDILGEYVAVTDIPAVIFAEDLLDAYPDAKVVLNKREDLSAWKSSFRTTTLAAERSIMMKVLSYFNYEFFWLQRTFEATIIALFHGDFESNAEKVYGRHYDKIETALQGTGRSYLEWKVQDGWEPLCQFLDKAVPDEEFPRGNAKQEHDQRIGQLVSKRVSAAMRNAAILFSSVLGIIFACWWMLL